MTIIANQNVELSFILTEKLIHETSQRKAPLTYGNFTLICPYEKRGDIYFVPSEFISPWVAKINGPGCGDIGLAYDVMQTQKRITSLENEMFKDAVTTFLDSKYPWHQTMEFISRINNESKFKVSGRAYKVIK